MIARLDDWQARLSAYLSEVHGARFRAGRFDCALFVAGAVFAVTGHDFRGDFEGRYDDLDGGRDLLLSLGYSSLSDLAGASFSQIDPVFARAGDIAVIDGSDGCEAFAVIQGAFIYVLGRDGVSVASKSEIKKSFRVG